MKKLFLLISSIFYALNAFACWRPAYTQEEHKHYLIPDLFTNSYYSQSLIPTSNNLHYDVDYNIYNHEFEKLTNRLSNLGISQSTIELMNTRIVKSVSVDRDYINISFKANYKHSKVKIYDITIYNFYPKRIIDEFRKINQLKLLNYLMYRHIVLFDSKYFAFNDYKDQLSGSFYLSDQVKNRLRNIILDELSLAPFDLKEGFIMLLIDMSLFSRNHIQIVSDYMLNLNSKKEINVVAYSHFAGAVVKMYAVSPSYAYMDYRNNNELSVYLFSRLFEYPKLFRKAMIEISFVADKKDFDWNKCFSYCKNQEEKDRISLAKVLLFSGVNISLLDYFKDNTSSDSKLFELALIQYTQHIEYHLFSPLYLKRGFYENYKKNSDVVNKFALADAIDLQNYIYKIDINNKVLLHLLRGYLSFMLGDFSKARQEYGFSKDYLRNANYLSKKEKDGYATQLEGLLVLERYNRDYSINTYKQLNNRLTSFLEKTYESESMDSYFELGMEHAVKRHDFAEAFCFTSNKGYHLKNMLDIFMDNDDLHEILNKINQKKLPFNHRQPKDLKYAIIEQIGTNYFRDNDLTLAKTYFDLLPDHIFDGGTGGRAYYQHRPYSWNYYDFPIDFSKNNSKIVKTYIVKTYNKKTVLNKIIELESDIKIKGDRLNSTFYNDTVSISFLRNELSNLYFELSCMYSSPFWGYSRFWSSGLNRGIYYLDAPPFNLLETQFIKSKLDSFLHKYGNQYKSIHFLNKAISYEDDQEIQAQLNFKLYSKLKKPFLTSFHDSRYTNSRWWRSDLWNMNYAQRIEKSNLKKEKIITALLIKSLYRNTNYYKEVISECSDFKRVRKPPKDIKEKIEEPTKIEQVGVNYKLVSLFLIIIVLGLFAYILSRRIRVICSYPTSEESSHL